MSYKPIPVEDAREIAAKYDKTMVVILAWDPKFQVTHTTTYGVSAFEKEQAAAAGEIACQALGGDLSRKSTFEDFHENYDPALLREATEILKTIRSRNGTNSHMLQRIERWLDASGRPLRSGG